MQHDCFRSRFNVRSCENLSDTTLRAVLYRNLCIVRSSQGLPNLRMSPYELFRVKNALRIYAFLSNFTSPRAFECSRTWF